MSNRYNVQVGYQIYHVTWIEVEAENEQEARSLALTKAGDQPLEYEPDPYDEGSSLESLNCEELIEEESEPCN